MISWILALIVLALLTGIILLSAKSPLQKLTREEFLRKLAEFLEGEVEPITGYQDGAKSYRIRFEFKDEEFVYEDLERQGFKNKIYKTYLKIKTPSKLTLTFTEKKRSTRIRSDIFIASDVSSQYFQDAEVLRVPECFSDLKVFANDTSEANRILEDKKIVSFFRKYKNFDSRGYPFLSLGIVDGVVILEFRAAKIDKPSISSLREDVSSIDDYLEQLIVMTRKLREKS